jgi:hypothetical protein
MPDIERKPLLCRQGQEGIGLRLRWQPALVEQFRVY